VEKNSTRRQLIYTQELLSVFVLGSGTRGRSYLPHRRPLYQVPISGIRKKLWTSRQGYESPNTISKADRPGVPQLPPQSLRPRRRSDNRYAATSFIAMPSAASAATARANCTSNARKGADRRQTTTLSSSASCPALERVGVHNATSTARPASAVGRRSSTIARPPLTLS